MGVNQATIVITARRPRLSLPTRRPPTVAVDDRPAVVLAWGVPISFEVSGGEHVISVSDSVLHAPAETCCWADEEGVELEYRSAMLWYLPGRIRYLT